MPLVKSDPVLSKCGVRYEDAILSSVSWSEKRQAGHPVKCGPKGVNTALGARAWTVADQAFGCSRLARV